MLARTSLLQAAAILPHSKMAGFFLGMTTDDYRPSRESRSNWICAVPAALFLRLCPALAGGAFCWLEPDLQKSQLMFGSLPRK